MERSIIPASFISIGDAFEFSNALLGNLGHSSFVGRIAEVNSTAERPRRTCCAKSFDLKWTTIGRDWKGVCWSRFEQDFRFKMRNEQRVAILFETATFPGCLAPGSGRSDRSICLVIDFQNLLPHKVGHGDEFSVLSVQFSVFSVQCSVFSVQSSKSDLRSLKSLSSPNTEN